MKAPSHWSLHSLVANAVHNEKRINGRWVPARPIGMNGTLTDRIRLAVGVFIGKYDAVEWPEGQ